MKKKLLKWLNRYYYTRLMVDVYRSNEINRTILSISGWFAFLGVAALFTGNVTQGVYFISIAFVTNTYNLSNFNVRRNCEERIYAIFTQKNQSATSAIEHLVLDFESCKKLVETQGEFFTVYCWVKSIYDLPPVLVLRSESYNLKNLDTIEIVVPAPIIHREGPFH